MRSRDKTVAESFVAALKAKLYQQKLEFPFEDILNTYYLRHFLDLLYGENLEQRRADLYNEYLSVCKQIHQNKLEEVSESN